MEVDTLSLLLNFMKKEKEFLTFTKTLADSLNINTS